MQGVHAHGSRKGAKNASSDGGKRTRTRARWPPQSPALYGEKRWTSASFVSPFNSHRCVLRFRSPPLSVVPRPRPALFETLVRRRSVHRWFPRAPPHKALLPPPPLSVWRSIAMMPRDRRNVGCFMRPTTQKTVAKIDAPYVYRITMLASRPISSPVFLLASVARPPPFARPAGHRVPPLRSVPCLPFRATLKASPAKLDVPIGMVEKDRLREEERGPADRGPGFQRILSPSRPRRGCCRPPREITCPD